ANPRRCATWNPILNSLKFKLSSWRGRLLSIGGRVTLINYVLSSLPLYFFSFFKAPVKVVNQIIRIQRNFLWGGGVEDRKLCWVGWEKVCLPKEESGLGIKRLDWFNQALLSKWNWSNDGSVVRNNSLWWRDICSIGGRNVIRRLQSLTDGGGKEESRHASGIGWRIYPALMQLNCQS
ncbi:putative ribonuclease H protein, partial [Trifolium medium]|nr:putative ribonuclease H protein [Trifolium medium]